MKKSTFYLLNLTWGLPINIVGGVVALWLICAEKLHPTMHKGCLLFTKGKCWGGVSFGIVTIVQEGASEHTKNHEFGHAVQNAMYGIFHPFLCLASVIRYHWRNWMIKYHPIVQLPPYDSFWFEAQATELGNKIVLTKGDK